MVSHILAALIGTVLIMAIIMIGIPLIRKVLSLFFGVALLPARSCLGCLTALLIFAAVVGMIILTFFYGYSPLTVLGLV